MKKSLLAEGVFLWHSLCLSSHHNDRNTRGRETNSRMSDEGSGLKISYPQTQCVGCTGKYKICIRRFVTRCFPWNISWYIFFLNKSTKLLLVIWTCSVLNAPHLPITPQNQLLIFQIKFHLFGEAFFANLRQPPNQSITSLCFNSLHNTSLSGIFLANF